MLDACTAMSASAEYAYLIDEIAFFQFKKFGNANIGSLNPPGRTLEPQNCKIIFKSMVIVRDKVYNGNVRTSNIGWLESPKSSNGDF